MRLTMLMAATAALTLPAGMAIAQRAPSPSAQATTPTATTQTGVAAQATAPQTNVGVQAGVKPTAPVAATPQGTSPPAGSIDVRADTAAAGQSSAHKGHAAVAAATPADLRAGVAVSDTQGGSVGTIESADAQGAVVATGKARAKLPLNSFGKNASGGLVVSMTKAQIEAAASAAAPTSAATTSSSD